MKTFHKKRFFQLSSPIRSSFN